MGDKTAANPTLEIRDQSNALLATQVGGIIASDQSGDLLCFAGGWRCCPMKTPCSDYVATRGILFFARMLDKLRLKEQGLLPDDYNYAGCPVPDCFDGYFCRFFSIDVPRLVERVRGGGGDDEILAWCFENFGRPDEEKIKFWNNFVVKRGWRDDSTKELQEVKAASGFGERADIQTWVDYHDADEGRLPRTNESFV